MPFQLKPVYVRKFREFFLGLANFIFSRGSVAAQWEVLLTENNTVTNKQLKDELKKAVEELEDDFIPGYPVDKSSIEFEGKCLNSLYKE